MGGAIGSPVSWSMSGNGITSGDCRTFRSTHAFTGGPLGGGPLERTLRSACDVGTSVAVVTLLLLGGGTCLVRSELSGILLSGTISRLECYAFTFGAVLSYDMRIS